MTEILNNIRPRILAVTQGAVEQILDDESFEVTKVASLSEAAARLGPDHSYLALWLEDESIESLSVLGEIRIPILLCAGEAAARAKKLREGVASPPAIWTVEKPSDPAQARQLALAVCQQHSLRIERDSRELALAGSSDGYWNWNLATGRVDYSRRWKSILGFEDAEISDSIDEWFNRIHPEDTPRVQAALDAHTGGASEAFSCEYRMFHKDGDFRWVQTRGLAQRDAAGKAVRIAGSQSDITRWKRAEERLQQQTLHDPLTGLANRMLLVDRVNACLMRAKRNPEYLFAVLFLDPERFKLINDSLGHEVGDQLLVEIAKRIPAVVRGLDTVARVETDHLARLGGDEFALLLDPIARPEDAGRVAERLLKALAEPFRIGSLEVITSVRMGIAYGNASTQRAEDLLREADAALNHAKRDQKQRYRIYNPEMHSAAMKRLSMEVELRQAIEREQLCLHFQPIHSLATGKIAEFEALVRWEHPQRGRISPGEFIPLAEETGLIVPLGSWVLRAACRQMVRWGPQAAGMEHVRIGVNVSGRQFARAELIAEIRDILRETGMAPGRLCLEITESTIMEHGAPMLESLQNLSALGVRLHLDDFGTGYSSMGYLNQMPIDVLKIDRSFITRISGGSTGRPIVQAIIALARSLHMEVIAEGVESEPVVSILTGMGCDYVQGYYLSQPLAADQALEYWRRFTHSLQLPMSNKIYISEAS
jgi:diguanylate cyclase (GGDEF)-like protein/PAS domain S-box-containing protein